MRPSRVGHSFGGLCRCLPWRRPFLDLPRTREGGAAGIQMSVLPYDLLQQYYREVALFRRFMLQKKDEGRVGLTGRVGASGTKKTVKTCR